MPIMKDIRKNFQKLFKYVIWLVILVFLVGFALSWGSGGKKRGESSLGSVNGQPLDEQRFSQALSRELEQYHSQFGGEASAGEAAKIKRRIFDAMIEESLAMQGAKALGLEVSNQELAQQIQSISSFRGQNGQFDMSKYVRYLQQQADSGQDQQAVEEGLRQRIEFSKLQDYWQSQVKASEAEIKEAMAKLSRQVKATYLLWAYKPLQAKVEVGEDKLKDYYSQNRAKWDKPAQVKASHILIKVDEGAGIADDNAAKSRALEILKQVQAGGDFSALAKKFSQDEGSAKHGGDLGFFSQGQMVPEFEKAAFALKKGGVSDLVKSKFGYHIIKVTDRKEAFAATFANCRDKAKEEYTMNQARQIAQQQANLAGELLKSLTFDETAKALTVTPKTTGWFGRDDEKAVPEAGKSAPFARAMLELDKDVPCPRPLALEKGMVVAEITQEKAGAAPKGEDAGKLKADALRLVQQDKADLLFQGWIQSLKNKAEIEDKLGEQVAN